MQAAFPRFSREDAWKRVTTSMAAAAQPPCLYLKESKADVLYSERPGPAGTVLHRRAIEKKIDQGMTSPSPWALVDEILKINQPPQVLAQRTFGCSNILFELRCSVAAVDCGGSVMDDAPWHMNKP